MGWFEERAGLDGTVAAVIGGAGGLGEAISVDLAANGVRLAVIDIDESGVNKLRQTLEKRDCEALIRCGDARDAEALASLFAAVDERWGRLDTLVNVVGGTFQAAFTDTRTKGWDALLRVNLLYVLHACALAIPRMRAGSRGGSIINLTTIEAHRAAPGHAVYAAAKAAVEQFARTLAVELGPDGIRVNNVAPNYSPTPAMISQAGSESSLSEPAGLRIRIPMGRAGTVSDVSNCVVFLASALSAYITGTTLHPDGGVLASSGWFNWPGSGWGILPMRVAEYLSGSE